MSGPAGAIPVTKEPLMDPFGDNTLVFLPTGVSYAKPAPGQSFPVWIEASPGSSPVCRYYIPPGTQVVYRVFSNRADANHRYMIVRTLRDQMIALGWLAEGDGADLVVMCVHL